MPYGTPISPETLAQGVVPPRFDLFGGFNAGQEFAQKLQERQQQQALHDLFRSGNFDWSTAAEQLLRIGGPGQIGNVLKLQELRTQQEALKGLGDPGAIFTSPRPRADLPPSTNRTGLRTEPQEPTETPTAANTLRPDQPGNLTAPGTTITGIEVEDQPAPAFAPTAPDTRYPPQFQQPPAGGFGPAVGRFAPQSAIPQQALQAQAQAGPQDAPPPPPRQSPVPPGAPGFFSEQNAQAYEAIANRANWAAARMGFANTPASAAIRQQGEQAAAAAKQIREHIGNIAKEREQSRLKLGEEREKSRLHEGRTVSETVSKANIDRLEKGREKASTAAEGISSSQDLFDQLNAKSGIFSGAWANERLRLAQIAQQLGYPIDVDKIRDTQTFMALIGRQVAAGVKAFGSGTSITDADREFVRKMVGGDITLDEGSIRRILEINDKMQREIVKRHNADVDRVGKAEPAVRERIDLFKVEMPAKIEGRMDGPKTYKAPSGRTYEITPDGKLGREIMGQ